MRASCTPSAVEREYLAATRGAVLLPLVARGAAQVQHAPHGVRLSLRAAAHLPLSSVHLTADQARALAAALLAALPLEIA